MLTLLSLFPFCSGFCFPCAILTAAELGSSLLLLLLSNAVLDLKS